MVKDQDIFVVFPFFGHVVTEIGDCPPIFAVDLFEALLAFMDVAPVVLGCPERLSQGALLLGHQLVFEGVY